MALLHWLHLSEPGAASVFLTISGFIVSKSALLPWLQVQNGGVFTVYQQWETFSDSRTDLHSKYENCPSD